MKNQLEFLGEIMSAAEANDKTKVLRLDSQFDEWFRALGRLSDTELEMDRTRQSIIGAIVENGFLDRDTCLDDARSRLGKMPKPW